MATLKAHVVMAFMYFSSKSSGIRLETQFVIGLEVFLMGEILILS